MTREIIDRFKIFHKDNPVVYNYMLTLCHNLIESGYDHYGARAIFERMRWHFNVDLNTSGSEGEFAFSNDFPSLYARKLMSENPELGPIFQLKRLKGMSEEEIAFALELQHVGVVASEQNEIYSEYNEELYA